MKMIDLNNETDTTREMTTVNKTKQIIEKGREKQQQQQQRTEINKPITKQRGKQKQYQQ